MEMSEGRSSILKEYAEAASQKTELGSLIKEKLGR